MKLKYIIKPCVEEDEDLVEEKLDAFCYSIVPPEEGAKDEDIVFKITDGEGNIIAGCIMEIESWKFACLFTLWVDEKYRGKGLGSSLIREAEKTARKRNCYAMIIGTFDFQARPLYVKHGYKQCGITRDYPRGHELYDFLKRLDRPAQEYVPSKDLSASFEISEGDEKDAVIIRQGLKDYDTSQAGRSNEQIPLNKKALDENGNMIAAIFAGVGRWNHFYIDMVWVEEPYRNQGIGSELLAETEREAKERGAYFAQTELATDWNVEFFKKNGYTAVGAWEDVPKGHVTYILEKRF